MARRKRLLGGMNNQMPPEELSMGPSGPSGSSGSSGSSDIIKETKSARVAAQGLRGQSEAILVCVVLFLATLVIYFSAGEDPSVIRYQLCLSLMAMTFAASGSFLLFKSMDQVETTQIYILMGITGVSFASWATFAYLLSAKCDSIATEQTEADVAQS